MPGIELSFPDSARRDAVREQGEARNEPTPGSDDSRQRGVGMLARAAKLAFPVGCILIALGVDAGAPNVYPAGYETLYLPALYWISLGVYAVFLVISAFSKLVRAKLVRLSGLLGALYLLVCLFEVATVKTGLLILPFIPGPDAILSVYVENYETLVENFSASMILYGKGLFFGVTTGFLSGILLGWSRICDYWFSPVLRIIGPVPSVAWLPIAVVIMPSAHLAGIFLIALSVWFPLTFLLSSAIKNTNRHKVEAARTLGAKDAYILFHVALPAALPDMFTGLFMGLAMSFSSLIAAEQLGVKAGLGWYISWRASWADYSGVFAAVGVFIVLFYVLIMLLIRIRNNAMKWQKDLVRW